MKFRGVSQEDSIEGDPMIQEKHVPKAKGVRCLQKADFQFTEARVPTNGQTGKGAIDCNQVTQLFQS